MRKKNLLNKKFGRLAVVGEAGRSKSGKVLWECQCDCGTHTIVLGCHLTSGHTKSCGCSRIEMITTHNGHGRPEYKVWSAMIQRCENPKNKGYRDYGGRGIKVSESWRKFENFFTDMGKRPNEDMSLDRINNNGDYCSENCQWATQTQQSRNTRKRKTNKSGVRGVSWNKDRKKFVAYINVEKRRKSLGYFSSFAAAKAARFQAEKKYWKEDKNDS